MDAKAKALKEKAKENRMNDDKVNLSTFILLTIMTLLILALTVINSVNIEILSRKNSLREIEQLTSGDVYSTSLGELTIDYDDDKDVYDCFLVEENRHVYIPGKNIIFRPNYKDEVELYELDKDKYLLVFYFKYNLED